MATGTVEQCAQVQQGLQHNNSKTLATSRCNGLWETTRHNTQRACARANLLRTCNGETGVMDFGLI